MRVIEYIAEYKINANDWLSKYLSSMVNLHRLLLKYDSNKDVGVLPRISEIYKCLEKSHDRGDIEFSKLSDFDFAYGFIGDKAIYETYEKEIEELLSILNTNIEPTPKSLGNFLSEFNTYVLLRPQFTEDLDRA